MEEAFSMSKHTNNTNECNEQMAIQGRIHAILQIVQQEWTDDKRPRDVHWRNSDSTPLMTPICAERACTVPARNLHRPPAHCFRHERSRSEAASNEHFRQLETGLLILGPSTVLAWPSKGARRPEH